MNRRIRYRSILWLAILIGLAWVLAGGRPEGQTLSQAPRVNLFDEGVLQGSARTLNFVGAGVTSAIVAGDAVITIAGGVGSSNVVEKSIDLGTSGGLIFSATVTGQAWVTASSVIVCGVLGTAADGQTIETIAAAALQVTASNRVAATGFDLSIFNPYGATGIFRFHCTGA